MSYQVIWSNQSENQLDSIFDYYLKHSTLKIARKIINEIIDEPNKLVKNLEIGQIEMLLKGRKNEYRYLICNNYKIIYSLDKSTKLIKISDVFDTRQHPKKMNRIK